MRVCVVGAGIAGTAAAYWLAKADFDIVVIERALELEASGQGIDIAGPAREIVRKMGLETEILARTTKEGGLAFVDDKNQSWGVFDVGDDKTDIGFTREIEINRGDLAQIFYEAASASKRVEFRFGTTIESLKLAEDKATVTFSGLSTAEDFDLVIGADGLGSHTRKLVLSQEQNKECYRPVGVFTSFFSIPKEEQDWPRGRWYNAPGGRTLVIRPRNEIISSAYLTVVSDNQELELAAKADRETQKAQMEKIFRGTGWESDRILRGMKECGSYYFSPIAQIKVDGPWSQGGRCILLSDAACSPSPLTGFGTTGAIVGAYVLAGELSKRCHETNPAAALDAYEHQVRPYLEKGQQIPLGGKIVYLVNPQTAVGIRLLRLVTWLVSWSGIVRLFGNFEPDPFNLPQYRMFERV